jgi:hypothetical protein
VNDICKPMVIKELAPGVILYDYAIVFTKPGKALFIPCSVGEAYNRLIAYYESAIKSEPYYDIFLNPLKEEHARLTPDELKLPAYFGGITGITWQKPKTRLCCSILISLTAQCQKQPYRPLFSLSIQTISERTQISPLPMWASSG